MPVLEVDEVRERYFSRQEQLELRLAPARKVQLLEVLAERQNGLEDLLRPQNAIIVLRVGMELNPLRGVVAFDVELPDVESELRLLLQRPPELRNAPLELAVTGKTDRYGSV